jgi:hypothetical protein
MGKSGAVQMIEQALSLPAMGFQKASEANFALASETPEASIVEKLSGKLNVKGRFNRLRKRMRNRSTNIL